jgi:putative phosphoribosyl transferase
MVREVEIPIEGAALKGTLTLPWSSHGLVLFAHGSGSSRMSPRNQFVANILNQAQLGTLLFDLLTVREEREDSLSGHLRFDIDLLSKRLLDAVDWTKAELAPHLKLGLFGASTGAAAALVTAARRPFDISAVVSRGGRPDLAGSHLSHVFSPTLLIVGERDDVVTQLNEEAFSKLPGEKRLIIVPHATHLFEEAGALEEVSDQARRWFDFFLRESGENGPVLNSI